MAEAFGKVSSSKYSGIRIRPGDRVRLVTPGGGGHGDPRGRSREAVRADLAEGFVSPAQSAAAYGYAGEGDD